jgi:hypothetical protein
MSGALNRIRRIAVTHWVDWICERLHRVGPLACRLQLGSGGQS